MAKKGMVPEDVDKMAGEMENKAQEIRTIYTEVKGQVDGLDWTGQDRDKYVADFEAQIGAAVQAIEGKLGETAERARQNAQAQRQASSAGA
ncbi:WXG100 family type VII secretion target [Brachybacterium sp. EF45031]|uniref:WXG100 family type VII secretion target n=1 Tax=Brachybacterium sillae TaxID=2810536 RepID=UPI00217E2242|nr:WXG100 family type VII secretion target [Brachybacterium sillae]MCS6711085.1 WXG100 family type VII secretion target [Brachybacterium sillae]